MQALGPTPGQGSGSDVRVNGAPLVLRNGTYKVIEAPRFGEKISTGDLRYADFNTFESAHAVALFTGGYGLRRYSDVADSSTPEIQSCYDEAEDVDCRYGPAILALQRLPEVTGLDGPIVWMGEFTPARGSLAGQTQFIAVGGTQVAHRHGDSDWHVHPIALPAQARRGAVGVFNGNLIFGFGSDALAVYSDDIDTYANVTNQALAPLYLWAFTSDRAQALAAGGPLLTDANKLIAGTNGATNYDTDHAVTCSTSEGEITGLSPGGGLVLVFVGRDRELGCVDNNAIYRSLVAFDSSLPTNCVPMRWGQGGLGQGEQRGSVRIFYSRDRSLEAYSPSTATTGGLQDMSVWGKQGFRPQRVKGITTAIQGTSRWLYHTIYNATLDESFLLAADMNSGVIHVVGALGPVQALAMGVTSIFGDRPTLFIGAGADIVRIRLPLEGENPIDDPEMFYQLSGTLTMPDIDLGFPDEDKVGLFFRLVATAEVNGVDVGLQPGTHSIDVEMSFDGGPYVPVGTMNSSPSVEFAIPDTPTFKRAKPRFTLRTSDPASTPQLLGFSLRVSLNAKLYRIWDFEAMMLSDTFPTGGQDTRNPQNVINDFWVARIRGRPVEFTDRWGFQYTVRILQFAEQEITEENLKTPETMLSFRLLELTGPHAGPYSLAWGSPLTIWGGPMPNSTWGL